MRRAGTILGPGLRFCVLGLVACVVSACLAWADPSFPALTGRVVDDAGIISPDTRQAIETKLADLEAKSSIQLVVATIPSLGGQEIEPYANGLFRAWKLGDAKRNTGVLLLVAPTERKVRIEVGYGEEGTLTDALSKVIITNAMVPRFRTGDFSTGIARGVDDIIAVLTTDSGEWQKRPSLRQDRPDESPLEALLPFLIFAIVLFVIWRSARGRGRVGGMPWILPPSGGGWGGSGGFGGGGFSGGGGGFSGDGGSSGGGGASGGW